jgi:hypothetical protein|tara:strand:+ start:202 stop:420 length:219 start_codon:yes stop_codon:yes gene_type:complete
MSNNIRTTVKIADNTGHTTLQLTKEETIQRLTSQPNTWVFADNRLVDGEFLANADWANVGTILMPNALVGGN